MLLLVHLERRVQIVIKLVNLMMLRSVLIIKYNVADDHCVQVFHSADWTISHVIDGRISGDHGSFTSPEGIAFDLFGNVHVTGHYSSSVTIFTPSGQFIHQYDHS